MKLLFYKSGFAWPRASGHDVHAYNMMRAMAALGHDVALVTRDAPPDAALAGLTLVHRGVLSAPAPSVTAQPVPPLAGLQERFRSYWGVERESIEALAKHVAAVRPDAFVVVGLDVLPYLAAGQGAHRVWYAADEWFLHHLSLARLSEPSSWTTLKDGSIKLMYERAFAPMCDRTWVVSQADARAMRIFAGMKHVDVLPNGVDADHFVRPEGPVSPRTCAFWGRLDFEPNIQGLRWFCDRVWPRVLAAAPEARFRIFGYAPGPTVQKLASRPGVELSANVPDLRGEVARCAVAVLPFVTGGGIKNKILEAAALSMPIVCTRRACGGLRDPSPPFVVTDDPAEWANQLAALWSNQTRSDDLGARARQWVVRHHTWETAARDALEGLGDAAPGPSLASAPTLPKRPE